ncbi:MAG: stimulus-sensing domain-containing protein, partial [Stellaceae bacterium]
MALDIATATTDERGTRPAPRRRAFRFRFRARRLRRLSPLTRRILAVNVLAIALLGFGLLYLGEYQQSLVTAELESLRTQGQIFAAALGEGAVIDVPGEGEMLVPELGRDMMRRLVEPTHTRARLFDVRGRLIGDTRMLRGSGGAVQVEVLPPPGTGGWMERTAEALYDLASGIVPWRDRYSPYHERAHENASDYPEVSHALDGDIGTEVRADKTEGGLLLT